MWWRAYDQLQKQKFTRAISWHPRVTSCQALLSNKQITLPRPVMLLLSAQGGKETLFLFLLNATGTINIHISKGPFGAREVNISDLPILSDKSRGNLMRFTHNGSVKYSLHMKHL